jgi:hypothetical protein
MARRRSYKRDRNGRFARTGSTTRRPVSRNVKTAAKVGLTVALVATAGYKAGPSAIRYGARNAKRPPQVDLNWLNGF